MLHKNLYNLILGREPNDNDFSSILGQFGELRTLAAALLASHEFLVETAEPLLDGTLPGTNALAPQLLQQWAEAKFGLPSAPAEPRLAVIARIMESPLLKTTVRGLDLIWSPGAFKAAVQSALENLDEPKPTPAYPIAAARSLTRGLEIDALSGLSAGPRTREFRLEEAGASILFHLTDAPAGADSVCRIDFGLIADGSDPKARLCIDYGQGFNEALVLPLIARGRPRYAAFLAAPREIRALR